MPLRKITLFLGLAYLLAWSLGFGFFALGGKTNSGAFVVMAIVYMYAPAVAAIITQKFVWREPLRDLGLRLPRWSWMTVAWLLPVFLVLAGLAFSLLIPHTQLVPGLAALYSQAQDNVAPEKLAELHRLLDRSLLALPGVFLFISLGQVLALGPTVNAVAAFGEELGWRGLFLKELDVLGVGFWRGSLIIGFFWGVWHWPLIVHGYNYPGHPLIGPLMMLLLTILLSPLIGYVRLRAQSVFAAAVFHGTFNGAATLAVFVRGGEPLTTGMTGAAGMVALALGNFALWVHLRRQGSRWSN